MASINLKFIICVVFVLIVLAQPLPWATEREVRCNDPGPISNGNRSPAESIPQSVGSVIHFDCVPGYTINGTANLTCMSNGQWSDGVPLCQEKSVICKKPGQIRHGMLNTTNETYSAGEAVFYRCLPGFEIQGEASLTCTQNGTWSNDLPECKRKEVVCKDPGRVKNGKQSISRKSYSVGSRILYRCLSGYRIDGKASIICRSNGKWSHKAPLCEKRALRCKDPGRIRYGKRSVQIKKTHRTGSTILYRCYAGYKVNGTASITCKKDGNWSNEIPTCQPISCGKPSHINHGNYTGIKFTYRSGVTYKCDVGYQLIGKPMRRCRSNGKWTKKPKCEIYKCRIKGTLRIRYGTIKTTDKTYSHGSTLLFKCNKGYELVGTDSIGCLEGKWSARRLPYCRVKACPNPGFPDNGRRIGNNFRIGHSIRFTCQSGFKLIGSPVRTCLEEKQWSGSVAVCDDGSTDCPILGTPISGIKIGNRYAFGSTVRFECKEGFMLRGSSIRRCMFDGKWNGTEAKCVDEFHYLVKGVNDTAHLLRKNLDAMLEFTCSGQNSSCNTTGFDARARAIDLGKMQNGLDVLFVFDASSSIKKREFNRARKFAVQIVEELGATWKPGGTRIAAIVYGTKPELVFNFGDHGATTKAGVIDKLNNIRKLGGGTATRDALEMAKQNVFVSRKSKRQRVMFFVTDGRSNIGGPPEKAAESLRRDYGVEITAIGVGKEVKTKELYRIGDKKEDVIIVPNYKALVASMDKAIVTTVDYSPCGESSFDFRRRMVGGIMGNRGNWPWQVGIFVFPENGGGLALICGGALIDEQWVLTAAHCFHDNKGIKQTDVPQRYTIKAGDYDLSENEKSQTEVAAENIIVHDNYETAPFYENDIALVKLAKKVKFGPFVRTVCLPRSNQELLEPGNFGFVAGWGATQILEIGQKPSLANRNSKVLLHSAFEIQKNKICRETTTFPLNLNVTFCAGDGKGGNDTCHGDSGGSFVRQILRDGGYRWVSVGLVSWGEGCGQVGKYGYYTRVAPFVGWIQRKMRKDKGKKSD